MTSLDVAGQENSENQNENQEEGAQLSSEITRQCIEITERFRSGTLAKVSAILELQSTIPHDDEPTHLKALGAYLRVLDNFERIRGRVEPGGVEGDEDGEPGAGEREVTVAQQVALLDRISDHDRSLLDRMTDQPSAKSTSVHSRGSYATRSTHHRFRHPSFGHRQPSKISLETRKSPSPRSSTLPDYRSSLTQSGPISSQDVLLTSTMSSPVSTLLPTTIAARSTSESLNSSSDLPDQPGLSTLTGNGSSLGTKWLMPLPSSFLTEHLSCKNMGDTSLSYLHPSPMHSTHVSSSMIEPSEFVSLRDETSCSRTTTISQTSTSSGSKTPVPVEPERETGINAHVVEAGVRVTANDVKYAGGGMRDGAPTRSLPATMSLAAPSAVATATRAQSANNKLRGADRWAYRPRFARDFVWTDNEPPRTTLALWTESMPPFPTPPENELNNPVALDTIRNYPHLFKIVTPLDVDRLESLLALHPNRPAVASMCHGLRVGFWPWAITEGVPRPLVVDNSSRPLTDEKHVSFVRAQRDAEIALGRFSPAFGPDLLPGMTSIPIGVVPKPHSINLRLVVDQSSGDFSPNSIS